MKTILIPVFDGTIAKNILRTPILSILRETDELRIVIIPPSGKEDLYVKEFSADNVFIESGSLWHVGPWGSFFQGIFLHSIPTNFMRIRQADWFLYQKKYFHYAGASILRLLGHFRLWRMFLMTLGSLEPISAEVRSVYVKWSPDLVFAPTMIPSLEISLMRLAQKDGKKFVGMVKSWDNLTSKAFLRIFPDLLIVPNEITAQEAVNLSGYPK